MHDDDDRMPFAKLSLKRRVAAILMVIQDKKSVAKVAAKFLVKEDELQHWAKVFTKRKAKVTENDDPLLTRKQAAAYLNVRPHTLAVWHSTGKYKLPVVKVGYSVRYKQSDLEEFLKHNAIRGKEGGDAA